MTTTSTRTRKRAPKATADPIRDAAVALFGAEAVDAFFASTTQAAAARALSVPGKWLRDITRHVSESGGFVSRDPSLWVRDAEAKRGTLAVIVRRKARATV